MQHKATDQKPRSSMTTFSVWSVDQHNLMKLHMSRGCHAYSYSGKSPPGECSVFRYHNLQESRTDADTLLLCLSLALDSAACL